MLVSLLKMVDGTDIYNIVKIFGTGLPPTGGRPDFSGQLHGVGSG